MLGTDHAATLYAFTGWSGGKPVFNGKGITFSCRCEPAYQHVVSGQSIEETADTLFIAEAISAKPGDRITFNARNYLIKRVDTLFAFGKTHHLEILARAEGA